MPLQSGLKVKTYTTTVPLTQGAIYKFKIQARNLIGLSEFSSEIAIRAIQIPDVPTAPESTINSVNTVVSWTAPYNGGHTISSYTILLLASDGTMFVEDKNLCDGTDPTVVSQQMCTIPSVGFTSSTLLSLNWGSTIVAKVIATNERGSSDAGPSGGTAVIVTNPDPPTDVTTEVGSTQIKFMWTTPYDGGSTVIDYRITWDQGTGSTVVLQSGIIPNEYTVTGLTVMETYTFSLASRNVWGYS